MSSFAYSGFSGMDEHSVSEGTTQVSVRSVGDIPTALGASFERGGLILSEADLSPEFFDLRTGLAGELFQKFVNYGALLALVIPAPRDYGERFSELAHEHRRHPNVRIFTARAEAQQWLESRRANG